VTHEVQIGAALYGWAASVAGVVVDQRRQLDALRSRGMTGEPAPPSEDDPLGRQIFDAVAQLVDRNPDRLREVARPLSALAAILGEREP
jgi:hypothetical protein